MDEELENMWDNKVYKITKKTDVLEGHTVLISI